MLALICLKAMMLAIGLVPQGSPEQFRKPPTPAEVEREIVSRSLTSYRDALAAVVKARKKLEEEPDPKVRESRAGQITLLKECEADFQKRIESLERGKLTPPTEIPRPR